jgi:hypothetical protein
MLQVHPKLIFPLSLFKNAGRAWGNCVKNFAENIPTFEVWAFGSRIAQNQASILKVKEYSDLDLARIEVKFRIEFFPPFIPRNHIHIEMHSPKTKFQYFSTCIFHRNSSYESPELFRNVF